jgi:MinD superfamily P-loop ATPase
LVTELPSFGLNDLKLSVETLRGTDNAFGVIINRTGLGNREIQSIVEWLPESVIRKEIRIIYKRVLSDSFIPRMLNELVIF